MTLDALIDQLNELRNDLPGTTRVFLADDGASVPAMEVERVQIGGEVLVQIS